MDTVDPKLFVDAHHYIPAPFDRESETRSCLDPKCLSKVSCLSLSLQGVTLAACNMFVSVYAKKWLVVTACASGATLTVTGLAFGALGIYIKCHSLSSEKNLEPPTMDQVVELTPPPTPGGGVEQGDVSEGDASESDVEQGS